MEALLNSEAPRRNLEPLFHGERGELSGKLGLALKGAIRSADVKFLNMVTLSSTQRGGS